MDLSKLELVAIGSIPVIFIVSLFFVSSSLSSSKGSLGEDKKCPFCSSTMRGTIYGEFNCETCKD